MEGLALRSIGGFWAAPSALFRASSLGASLLLLCMLSSPSPANSAPVAGPGGVPLRYLALNVGNFGFLFCWETKICRERDVQDLRAYIDAWQPDVIMLSEVVREAQLTGTENFGPILPDGYDGKCGESRDRETGELVAWNADNASHEHECVAWKTSRLSYVEGSALSAYGRNDIYGKANCPYDRTGFRARLLLDGVSTITAVAVHPHAADAECRTDEISRYWSKLTGEDAAVIIGGDFNTDSDAELQVPARFQTNYSRGQHWDIAAHEGEYSAVYGDGLVKRQIDHAFSSFGQPCVNCGATYGTADLAYGSALGGYDDHPRADGNYGFDHRQMLVDMVLPPVDLIFAIDTTGSMADDIASVKTAASQIIDAVASISPQFRVAVTEYKDFPVPPYGDARDYPYRAVVPFSSDPDSIRSGLLSLKAGGGGDRPESVYWGLMHAIGTDGLTPWRDGVTKVIIVMGDAPPHDPEPFSGFTLKDVATAAFNVDPAIIHSVVIGNDPDAFAYFSRLADETKGKVFTALDASAVLAALLDAIGDIAQTTLNRPPDCAVAAPSVSLLWPPNHDMRAIKILNVTDPDGDPVSLAVTGITQDEPVGGSDSRSTSPDGKGVGKPVARVRAERSGRGNGRVYEISFQANDGRFGQCSGRVRVCVPHDRRRGAACVDDGQHFDSTRRFHNDDDDDGDNDDGDHDNHDDGNGDGR